MGKPVERWGRKAAGFFEVRDSRVAGTMSDSCDPITVLLIDPNDISRAGLRVLLSEDEGFSIVADTASDGLSLANRLKPRLILVDPDIGGEVDVVFLAKLATAAPQSYLCVRTSVADPGGVLRAIEAGAFGYFLKAGTDSTFLREALWLIGRYGAPVTDPTVALAFREGMRDRSVRLLFRKHDQLALTEREREVLWLLATGSSDKEIASRLSIGRTTVETYVLRLRTHLGAETRAHLMILALRAGLLDL